jgi:hypothetical protein
MPYQLNRRALFAAAAAFLVALAVAYALSSAGQASPGTGPPGSPAQPLDVASGIADQSTLGDAQALPALVHKPKPKPPKKAADTPGTPVTSNPAPSTPAPPVSQPPAVNPTPTPPSPTAPTQVFSDSG